MRPRRRSQNVPSFHPPDEVGRPTHCAIFSAVRWVRATVIGAFLGALLAVDFVPTETCQVSLDPSCSQMNQTAWVILGAVLGSVLA